MLVVVLALVWHLWAVVGTAWPRVQNASHGRDFASYYYAGRAALEGRNPWDKRELSVIAREDGTRKSVHPFLYPPPFVLAMVPFAPLELLSAFHQWFWITEAMGVLATLLLALWWRRLHWSAPAVMFLLLAAVTAVPNNLAMGQANFPVLLLLVGALWLDANDRQLPAGILLGMAAMAKMSPALFVMWWMVQRRWTGVLAAIGTAVVLTLVSLLVVPVAHQVHFYVEVLPQFASGRYNGLSVPIQLFGNHSIPNVVDRWFPGGRGLSTTAVWIGRLVTLGSLALCGTLFHRRGDTLQTAAQASAIAVLMLLLPVYTYEHHLVWALPAAGLVIIAVLAGRLPWVTLIVALPAVTALAWDLQHLKSQLPWLQEAKMVALLVLFALCTLAGATLRPRPRSAASEPDR